MKIYPWPGENVYNPEKSTVLECHVVVEMLRIPASRSCLGHAVEEIVLGWEHVRVWLREVADKPGSQAKIVYQVASNSASVG
jgi:hypothetical protein